MSTDIIQQQNQQLQEENRRLRKAVEELSILNDVAVAITSTQSLDRIVDLIVEKCVKHLRVEQGALMLLDKEVGSEFRTMVRRADKSTNILPYRFDTQLTGWMLKNQRPLLINDFHDDERFQGISQEVNWPITSVLSVPLLLKGQMIGVLSVFNKKTADGFTADDQRLLSIISAQSAQIIENARLHLEEQALLQIQEELRLATQIQTNLMPVEAPPIPGYQVAAKNIPAKEVGGDYYDYIPIDENRLAVCLGDVTGKGMPAALLMANLQATLRGQSLVTDSCRELIARSNTLMFRSTESNKFATLFYGILDVSTHTMHYCNAGHDQPYLISQNGDIRRLETGGTVLGFLENFPFDEAQISINPGDILVVYSDGIPEAMNSKEEPFGEDRLLELVKGNVDNAAEEIIQGILTSAKAHAGEIPQSDDMTLLVIKREI